MEGNLKYSMRPEQLKVGQPGTLVGGENEGSTKLTEAAGGPERGACARSGAGHVQEAERLSPDRRCVSVPPRVSVKTLQQECAGGKAPCPLPVPPGTATGPTCPAWEGFREPVGPVLREGSYRGVGWPVTLPGQEQACLGWGVCLSLARLSPCARRPPRGPR